MANEASDNGAMDNMVSFSRDSSAGLQSEFMDSMKGQSSESTAQRNEAIAQSTSALEAQGTLPKLSLDNSHIGADVGRPPLTGDNSGSQKPEFDRSAAQEANPSESKAASEHSIKNNITEKAPAQPASFGRSSSISDIQQIKNNTPTNSSNNLF